MKEEFHRFGIPKYRKLVGGSQLIAAIIMALGFFFPILIFVAACGLALQMLFGVILRISIKDSLLQASPAFLFMILNIYLAAELAKKIFL